MNFLFKVLMWLLVLLMAL